MTRTDGRRPPTHALLADGGTVEIRPAKPADHGQVRRLHEQMSDENVRLRFFSAGARQAEQTADRICAPGRPGHRALLALSAGHLVGVAEYQSCTTPDSAEIALAVADDFHDRGVGTLLLEHLIQAAREDGITTFTAESLSENHAMLKVFTDLGLSCTRHFDGPEVRCTVRLDQDESYLTAVEERGAVADTASLVPLLRPRSVAVVGAGRRSGSVGRAVLRNLRRVGFAGSLHAVNAHTHTVEHTSTYPSVRELPHPPDLAVLTVPAYAVPEMAEECGACGVRALVVLTAGLDTRQGAELLAACRRHGMRLVGPNCLGVANLEEGVRLDATFAARPPQAGTAGVATQSGGIGIALLSGLSRLGIGVSSFLSLGDKYDVSGNDLLQWWETDGRTDIALLHLESFGNPRAFSRTARRVARRIPVLTIDAGRSDAGRRAAASHTAAAATPTMTRQALFTQAGIIATRTVAELLDTAALLHAQRLPKGGSVAVVSNAGGAGVLAADACAEAGLTVPELPAELITELLGVLPEGAMAANPVDMTAAAGADALSACVDRLTTHGAVDAVVVALVPTALAESTGDDPLRALTDVPGRRTRPVVAVLLDQDSRVRLLPTADGAAVPAYADPRSAAHSLAHAVERTRWLARDPGVVPDLPDVDTAGAERLVGEYLAESPDGGWLDPSRCAELLDCYRVPQMPWAWAEGEQAAVEATTRLTGPRGRAVLKAYWPGLMHKSDQGAVILDLSGEDEVRAAHRDLTVRFGDIMTGVVVQPMAAQGTELLAGVVQDEVFGPLVLFGLGGTSAELLADHAARLAPLTDRDVSDLITGPRISPLLFGYRGRGAVDLNGLEHLLLRLSRMACELPQLAEADLNPVVARPEGVMALDVRVRLVPRRAPAPYLRRLR